MIVTVLGARPQFVKAAVVSRALSAAGVEECVVHTGQHYDDRMSALFWRELELPGIRANLAVGSGAHGAQTGQMMERLEAFINQQDGKVSGMLVYGDTNSTLAGALVAAKLCIPVFHVEAGLRSFDRSMPEEVNRVVSDHLSSVLFCPSDHARDQLAREGISNQVHVVGDVMLDAMDAFRPASRALAEQTVRWGKLGRARALLTIHRPANTDTPGVLQALLDALATFPFDVLWPIHPRVRAGVANLVVPPNVEVRVPLSYLEMLRALELCELVLTDSGGLQKEAYWSQCQCITLRPDTEWVETLHGGWNKLVGTDARALVDAVHSKPTTPWRPLYGDGTAAPRIAQIIRQHLP